MKKLATALCGSILLASLAAPVFAQPGGGPGAWTLDARIDEATRSLQRSAASGAIDHRGYEESMNEVHGLKRREVEWQRAHGGQIDPETSKHLEIELDHIVNRIHGWRSPW